MRNPHEPAQLVLGLCIMAVAGLTILYPWSFRTRASRALAHLPLLLLVLYPAYEATMPPDTNIRIDLLLMRPALALAGICYLVKVFLLIRTPR
jgi:hypothetical protein